MLVYDFEVFKYNWLVIFKNLSTKEYTIIIDNKKELEEFYNNHSSDLYIGYNNKHYDDFILKTILSGADPYLVSKLIIEDEKSQYNIMKALKIKDLKINSFDLIQDIKGMSLKEVEGFMEMSIEESSIDFNLQRPLTQDEINETIKYCKHDVDATEQFLTQIRAPYLRSKLEIARLFHLPRNILNKTNADLVSMVLGAKRISRDDELEYDLPKELVLNKPEYKNILKLYVDKEIDYKEKLTVDVAGVEHIFAWGGLHGAIPNFTYVGELWQIDATSFYPTLMIEHNYMSRNLKDSSKFKELVETRIKAKKEGNKGIADALKLLINSCYGAMKAPWNNLYDAKMANQVCITGQLFLTDLIEKIEPYSKLVQSNTDGILIIPYDKDKILEEIKKVEKRIRVNFEIDVFQGVWQKDVNNYIILDGNGKVKSKGAYVSQYHRARENNRGFRNSGRILDDAVVDYFIKGIDPEETINNCNDIFAFQLICKTGGSYENTYWPTKNGDVKVNKVNRVYASKDQSYGHLYKLKINEDGSTRKDSIANLPDHCLVDNAAICDISQIDKSWYIKTAKERIKSYKGEK